MANNISKRRENRPKEIGNTYRVFNISWFLDLTITFCKLKEKLKQELNKGNFR